MAFFAPGKPEVRRIFVYQISGKSHGMADSDLHYKHYLFIFIFYYFYTYMVSIF